MFNVYVKDLNVILLIKQHEYYIHHMAEIEKQI